MSGRRRNGSVAVGLAAAAMMVSFMASCSETLHKDYAYAPIHWELAAFAFHARLVGRDTEPEPGVSVRGGVYDLFVWVSAPDGTHPAPSRATLEELELRDRTEGRVVLHREALQSAFGEPRRGTRDADFVVEGLNLAYHDYGLRARFSVDGAGSHQVDLDFEKAYSEKKQTLWDSLMGI